MNFSFYFLLFILLGTLFFGFAFPFMIAFIALIFVFLVALWLFRLFRGGSGFTVYTSRSYDRPRSTEEPRQESRQKVFSSEESAPPRRDYDNRGKYINVAADDEEMAEATEVIELPATALRKDDEDETK